MNKTELRQNGLAIVLILALCAAFMTGCNAAKPVDEGEPLPVETVSPGTSSEDAHEDAQNTATESSDTRTFLEKERENDPIMKWVDPYTDEELAAWEMEYFSEPEENKSQEEYDKYHDYIFKRACRFQAENNYPVYYYFMSGRSEYNGERLAGHRNDGEEESTASYAVPQSFILNMRADACVKMRFKDIETMMVDRIYENEADMEKQDAQGTSRTFKMEVLYFDVIETLWGDPVEDLIAYIPRLIGDKTLADLMDPDKQFVAFVYKHNDACEYGTIGAPEYGLRTRGLFELTDSGLESYSNIADVAAFDGKTPEEMVSAGIALAKKYPEIINMKFN